MLFLLVLARQELAGAIPGSEQFRPVFNQQRYGLLHQSYQHMDSLLIRENPSGRKSVFLATVYSGLLPGSGEFYSGSYWKAALFFSLELAGWTTYFIYDHKGNEGDKTMRAFADKNWSEQRYWSKLYYTAWQLNIPNLPDYDAYLQEVDNGYILTNYSPEVANSLRFLEEVPAMECTHRLPATHTQQYYEMIYKYLTQFGTGWQDADFFTTYYGNTDRMTPMMFEYRGMRNEMNHFYDIASGSLNAVLINHVLSALDAALTTRSYNRSLSVQARVRNVDYFGEKVQLYGLQLSW
jgi:hypothetical protein